MKSKALLFTISLFIFTFGFAAKVNAQSPSSYIWQYLNPKNVAGADDLKSRLEKEVQKVINSGHLAPFRAAYGEIRNPQNGQFYWYHRYDTLYTLSLAYPYVSASLQNSITTYLQSEMTTYPVWSSTLLSPQTGTRRNPDELTSAELGSLPNSYSTRPKLFALYALWLYAKNTGDWQYIQNNWSSITSFYNSNRSEAGQQYTSVAGAIGMARLARGKPTPDTSMQNTATNDATSGLNAGFNFDTFATNSFNAYQFDGGEGMRDYQWNGMFLGFQFLDITPEIGKYFSENSSLKTAVLGTTTSEKYTLKRVEYRWPVWYMAQGPMGTTYFGEGSGVPPDAKGMVFPLKIWVQKESPQQLRVYLDVPDSLLGDYYYMQNLTRTIEAHGQECWFDIQTNQEICGPTPSISPQPSSAPSPSPSLTSDFNHDGVVNSLDGKLLLTNWLTNSCGTSSCDTNQDSKNNSLDFAWVVKEWGN